MSADKMYEILKAKYQSDSALLKSVEAPSVMGVQKASKEATSKKVMHVVMSAYNYSESVIMKACHAFNSKNPKLMSSSYTLPAAMLGIPAGSWVLTVEGVSIE